MSLIISSSVCLFFLIVGIILISDYFLIPLPFLTRRQGVRSTSGEITRVQRLPGGINEAVLTHNLSIDPELQKGSVRMASASIGSYVYYRRGQQVPKIGEKVSVSTFGVLFFLKGRLYDFIQSSEETIEVLPSGKVILAKDHDPRFNHVDWEKTDIF